MSTPPAKRNYADHYHPDDENSDADEKSLVIVPTVAEQTENE